MLYFLPAAVPLLFPTAAQAEKSGPETSFFDFTVRLLDGTPQPFSAYRGKIVLVVNTASQCRFAPQFEGLEKLHQTYRDRGLLVLGFPSNDFRGREPGTSAEIGAFCRSHYGVTFPLFEKMNVIEPDASPLYRFLSSKHGPPKWNFHKYLVGRNGQVRQAFFSEITPESPTLRGAIENALRNS